MAQNTSVTKLIAPKNETYSSKQSCAWLFPSSEHLHHWQIQFRPPLYWAIDWTQGLTVTEVEPSPYTAFGRMCCYCGLQNHGCFSDFSRSTSNTFDINHYCVRLTCFSKCSFCIKSWNPTTNYYAHIQHLVSVCKDERADERARGNSAKLETRYFDFSRSDAGQSCTIAKTTLVWSI